MWDLRSSQWFWWRCKSYERSCNFEGVEQSKWNAWAYGGTTALRNYVQYIIYPQQDEPLQNTWTFLTSKACCLSTAYLTRKQVFRVIFKMCKTHSKHNATEQNQNQLIPMNFVKQDRHQETVLKWFTPVDYTHFPNFFIRNVVFQYLWQWKTSLWMLSILRVGHFLLLF